MATAFLWKSFHIQLQEMTSLLVDCVLKKFTLFSLLWWWPSCCFRYISDLVTFAYTQTRESVWKKYSEFYLSVDSIALILRLSQQIFFTIAQCERIEQTMARQIKFYLLSSNISQTHQYLKTYMLQSYVYIQISQKLDTKNCALSSVWTKFWLCFLCFLSSLASADSILSHRFCRL